MFTRFLLVAIVSFGLMGCEDGKWETTDIQGTLERTHIETFNLIGLGIGNSLKPPMGPAYAVAMARGCLAYIRVGNTVLELKRPKEFCKNAKKGDQVLVKRTAFIRTADGKVINPTYE